MHSTHGFSVFRTDRGGSKAQLLFILVDDLLVLVLVVPEIIGTGVAVGNNTFDADGLGLYQDFDEFFWEIGGEVSKEVVHFFTPRHTSLLPWIERTIFASMSFQPIPSSSLCSGMPRSKAVT